MSQFQYKKDNGLDTDYMPDVLAAEIQQESKMAPIFLLTIVGTIFVLILWAGLAQIDEITRGEGKVIPSKKLQIINHLEGGIIQDVFVREGDVVQKGQVLMKIDNTIAQARYTEGRTLYYRFLANDARLRAQIAGTPFVVPPLVLEKAPLEGEDATRIYNARQEDLKNAQLIANSQVEQKQQELNELTSRVKEINTQLGLVSEKVKTLTPLVKQKLEPEIALTDIRIRESEMRAEVASLQSNIAKANAALLQAQEQARQIPIKFKAEDWNELKDINNKLTSAQSSFSSEGNRFERTDIISPVHGIIKQIMFSTVGSVVQPAQDIVEIIPLDDSLLIEARINPKDVAFLRPGLKASIKITAYDYSIYGDLHGEVVRISADSITDEKGNVFYKVYVKTKGTLLSKSKVPLNIMPGMIASVDILTGKKSVLHYLMKPIIKTKDVALTER